MPSTSDIHVGFWTNWSRGYVLGATLTVPARDANTLIAFLALFVSWTGTNLWALISFAIHQSRCTEEPKDGIVWHVQALLRTMPSDLAMLWRSIQLGYYWRKRTRNAVLRMLPIVLICGAHFFALTAAGLFSSRVADTADEVLVSPSEYCGWIDTHLSTPESRYHNLSSSDLENLSSLIVTARTKLLESKLSSRTCFKRLDGLEPDLESSICRAFVVPAVISVVDTAAGCPFLDQACLTPATSLDTGLVDSHLDFGINAPPVDRIKFRKITVCAPLPMEDKWRIDSPSTDSNTKYYFVGPTWDETGIVQENYTFAVSDASRFRQGPYSPLAVTRYADNLTDSWFEPNPNLARRDADVNVIVILRNGAYPTELKDPLFRAQEEEVMQVGPAIHKDWVANDTLGALGCTEQYQFCANENCTELGGFYQVSSPASMQRLSLSEKQAVTVQTIGFAAWATRMYYTFSFLGDEILLARDQLGFVNWGLSGNIYSARQTAGSGLYFSAPLSNNQWQLEAENIHNIGMAKMLSVVANRPTPPVVLQKYKDFIIRPSTDVERMLCYQQKVRSADHGSFSVFGLAFIILGGIFITILRFAIPLIVESRSRSSNSSEGKCRIDEWVRIDILQLLADVLQFQNGANWILRDGPVPVTSENGELMTWDPNFQSMSFDGETTIWGQ